MNSDTKNLLNLADNLTQAILGDMSSAKQGKVKLIDNKQKQTENDEELLKQIFDEAFDEVKMISQGIDHQDCVSVLSVIQ
ncbi:hypothetical protein SS50377_26396 [Spironucleus salmonicida]|uniref:Uncharacterized protein n=1 Tax=Spironucleus salmonicida TaxID=348837 RepID=A0A9P8LQH2_9EUKA|nr:hypothetical protein SS50377_26396 [Spironucleus salmonicida]